jgi:ADP-ribose pyrophosphatase
MTSAADFSVVGSQHRYSGWAIDVRTDEVRLPDGELVKRDVIAHPGAVAVVALDDDERVVMVRQYRHPVRALLLELPAGLLDVDGEPALEAAKRELFEEAALIASEWAVLVDLHTSPGMTDEAIRVYVARDLTAVAEQDRFVSEAEELTMTVERYSLDELVELALAGELTNGPAVAGVLAAKLAEQRGWQGLRPADAPWNTGPRESSR